MKRGVQLGNDVNPYSVYREGFCEYETHKDPGLSPKMPDPNPNKFWEIFAFSLCEIPTKSLQIARRPVANPDKKLAGG